MTERGRPMSWALTHGPGLDPPEPQVYICADCGAEWATLDQCECGGEVIVPPTYREQLADYLERNDD